MLLAVLAGVAALAAALALYLLVERPGRAAVPLALLRAAAWGVVAALLVDPGCHRQQPAPALVLLDASRSMTDADGDARWLAARDTARALAGADGRILLFGAASRPDDGTTAPRDGASSLAPALREAAATGGPVAVITDGEVDDAAAIPTAVLATARVVLLPRRGGRDAGVAALSVPAALRAGDTVLAVVEVASRGTGPGDTGVVELREGTRLAARARVALGPVGGEARLPFVPAATGAARERRRYTAVVAVPGDPDARNDTLATVAQVRAAVAIVVVSSAPDWDSRRLAMAIAATAGVPVRSVVAIGAGRWVDARTLRAVDAAALAREAGGAALVVAHGPEGPLAPVLQAARGARWRWPAGAGATAGEWYVAGAEAASPIGAALAGVPAESLPALDAPSARVDSTWWVALSARRDRRGGTRPVLAGREAAGRRELLTAAGGLWRWAARGGIAEEAYRALVAAGIDWLLAGGADGDAGLAAVRDSLARSARELLPRPVVLTAQPGSGTRAAVATEPLRHRPWVFLAAVAALVLEWVGRRRVGLR